MIFALDLALIGISTVGLFYYDNVVVQACAAILFGWSAYGVYDAVRGE